MALVIQEKKSKKRGKKKKASRAFPTLRRGAGVVAMTKLLRLPVGPTR